MMNDANQPVIVQMIIPDHAIETIVAMTAETVYQRIRPLLSSTPKDDEIFDVKGLASYLKCTEAWIRDQARNGSIASFKSGKQWKFRKRDIDKAFKSRAFPVSMKHQ